MAESNYISIPTTESVINNCNKPAKGNSDEDSDVITLNILTMCSSNENNSASMPQPCSTTPTPSTTTRLFGRKPKNLQLKIESPSTESDNDILSSGKCKSASTNAAATSSSTSTSINTTNLIFSQEQSRLSKKLNIGFENLHYSVRTGFFRKDTKNILQGITGHFKAGELSAILGPSGAGKSTCLNILSGYRAYGFSGEVTVNGHVRDIKAVKSNVAFIIQDASLHSYLTVKEAMHFSANLKIGTQMSKSEKRERVKHILEAIGMYDIRHTRTFQLSGGQKKRLSVALELVINPPILIMDEPTTGLDISSSNQIISLLKKFALEGRTVICTIHQPSALTFQMIDHVYAIAEGSCIYSGSTQNLVPFLTEMGLQCPESYNPADYLMEIATDDYGPQNEKLIAKIENGKNDTYRQTKTDKNKQLEAMQKVDKMMAAGLITPVTAPIFAPTVKFNNSSPAIVECCPVTSTTMYSHNINCHMKPLTPIKEMSSHIDNIGKNILNESNNDDNNSSGNKGCCQQLESPQLCKMENIYATPFYRQLGILLLRTFLILWRDKSLAMMRVHIHVITALIIGSIYYGIGNEAENALNSFRYCFYSVMFIMFSAFSAIVVKFPLEFPIVSREHFNRWYSLRAYYVAITLADIPIQLLCTTLYIAITYILTDQPRDVFRLVLFSVIIFLTALVGQSIGLAVGASLDIKLAVILGPFFICPFLIFSGFFVQEQHAPENLKWIFQISFLKYSLDALVMAIFGFDRPRLECTAMYCHYARPKILLKDIDMLNANYKTAIIFLVTLFLVLRILSFYIMSFRLRLFR